MDIVSSNKVYLVKLSTQKIYYLLGAVGDLFFIIRSGEVRVTKNNDDGSENEVAVLGAGDFFGDKALIKEEKRSANIYAKSDLKCYTLDRTAFINLVGRVTDQDDPNKQAAPEVTLIIIDDFQYFKKSFRPKLLRQQELQTRTWQTASTRIWKSSNHLVLVDLV